MLVKRIQIVKEKLNKVFNVKVENSLGRVCVFLEIENQEILCNNYFNYNENVLRFYAHARYDFSFIKGCNGITITEEEEKQIENAICEVEEDIENMKLEKWKKQNVSYHYAIGFGTIKILKKYSAKTLDKAYHKLVEDNNIKKLTGFGDYNNHKSFDITNAKLLEMLDVLEEEIKKEKEDISKNEEEKEKQIFEKAKKTGEKQVLSMYSDECNDENEACDIDNIVTYAMPDGSTKTVRYHTW
jgi:hypothetical protein